MRWLVGIFTVLIALMVLNRALAADGLPPALETEQPKQVCVAIFDKFSELIDIECGVTVPETNGKKEPIRKGE